jgi:dipeptidyl aminopeptidase/acylaminoacyl peptidase
MMRSNISALVLLLAGCSLAGGHPAADTAPVVAAPQAVDRPISPSAAAAAIEPRIVDRPISFSAQRHEMTRAYIQTQYGIEATDITITPRVVVLHWTAIDGLEATFRVFDRETLAGRPDLAGAGAVNVSSQFVVDRDGTIYRLMPETWMARHVIGLNFNAIGVENIGGRDGVDDLTDAQVAANSALVRYLATRFPTIEYLIGHHEYQAFEGHPLWRELDMSYRTAKTDPGDRFMGAVRAAVADLGLQGPPPRPPVAAPSAPSSASRANVPVPDSAVAARDTVTVVLRDWLILGPAVLPLPAFMPDTVRAPAAALLDLPPHQVGVWPAVGDTVRWADGRNRAWSRFTAAGDTMTLAASVAADADVAYLATYLHADGHVRARLSIASGDLLRVTLDGRQVAVKRSTGGAPATAELSLPPGPHLLVVQAVRSPPRPLATDTAVPAPAWSVAASLRYAATSDAAPRPRLRVTTDAARPLRIADLLDTEAVSSLELSPDGELLAVAMRQPEVPAPNQETWVDIVAVRDGRVVRTFRGNSPTSAFSWAPDGRRFAYVTSRDGRATLWAGELDGAVRPVLRDVERFGSYRWLPGTRGFVYTVSTRGVRDDRGLQRMRGVQDRWAGWRDRSHLFHATSDGSVVRRLTAGDETTALQDISPDGTRLLLTRGRFTTTHPYSENELVELDLATLATRELASYAWGGSARYAPDGERILLVGAPDMFGDAGVNVPAGMTPNLYDSQGYILDRRTGAVTAFTRDFDPAIDEAIWAGADGMIYLRVQERDRTGLYRYDPSSRRFTRLQTGIGVAGALTVASRARRLAFAGSSAAEPHRVFALDLTGNARPRELLFPGRDSYRDVQLSRVEDFDFATADGTIIEGRLHLPPDFDASRRYPLIVMYYGGTTPVGRGFGGRYPADLWAGLGYAVYIPQPSGATGWGQEFSARHVNNWGITVAGEIIEGTERLLAAKPFLDRQRVGCIGASYGGFMTMLLTTRTDLFAGCVSHAGISSISSYWGEGWWGYGYNAAATAGSYPWNRPDIYIEQSPLFQADRIRTPLLLLHGTADTNVPPGESEQLYTALTLLGREVEYVRVEGEDHHILQYPKRVVWMETIIAWFDRTLKGDRSWWDALYEGR